MRKTGIIVVAAVLAAGITIKPGLADAGPIARTQQFGVGAQYGTTHVYVAAEDMDRFAASFLATFGGKSSQPTVVTVTPTPSRTAWQALTTPVGVVSLFGFKTPIPYPFGQERTGYLVTDMDAAVRDAKKAGAAVLVAPFPDAIGSDAVVQWPGGVNMQFYWHTKAPSYPPLQTVPETGYTSPPRPRRVLFEASSASPMARLSRITRERPARKSGDLAILIAVSGSSLGKITVLVTDGHLPYPYGRETMGYEVADLRETLTKAKASGATVSIEPYKTDGREAAVLQFPGGYIAEIHSTTK
jgi:predicted enzyme related to lactoylglutathione lyase